MSHLGFQILDSDALAPLTSSPGFIVAFQIFVFLHLGLPDKMQDVQLRLNFV